MSTRIRSAGGGYVPRHVHRTQVVHEPVEVDEEEHDADRDADPGECHADIRHRGVADTAQQSEREREGRDERGEHGLLQPVAVPQPHETG